MDLKCGWLLGLAGFARLCPGDQYEVSNLVETLEHDGKFTWHVFLFSYPVQ